MSLFSIIDVSFGISNYQLRVYNKAQSKSKGCLVYPLYNLASFVKGNLMSKSKLFPYLEASFAAIVWGASFIATKIALKDISPITIVWLRFAMGIIVLGVA